MLNGGSEVELQYDARALGDDNDEGVAATTAADVAVSVALSKQLTSAMASGVTNTSVSTNTDSGLKRTLSSVTQDSEGNDTLLPATKRPKKETKLDRLKAELKAEAVRLKTVVEISLALVKDKGVAKEVFLKLYVYYCDDILAGAELDENLLALFKVPFADNFDSEEVLLKNLNQGGLPP